MALPEDESPNAHVSTGLPNSESTRTSVTSVARSNVACVQVVQGSSLISMPSPVVAPVGSGVDLGVGSDASTGCPHEPDLGTYRDPPFELPPTPE
jgi:hypothetical protein